MGSNIGGRGKLGDAITFMTASFIGYGWSDIFGIILIGAPLLVLFVMTHIYIRRPAQQLRDYYESIDDA